MSSIGQIFGNTDCEEAGLAELRSGVGTRYLGHLAYLSLSLSAILRAQHTLRGVKVPQIPWSTRYLRQSVPGVPGVLILSPHPAYSEEQGILNTLKEQGAPDQSTPQ